MSVYKDMRMIALPLFCWAFAVLASPLAVGLDLANTAVAKTAQPEINKPEIIEERGIQSPAITASMQDAVNSARHLDWLPASKLNASQLIKMPCNCDGSYVSPPNLGPEANMDPTLAPLRLISDQASFDDNNNGILSGSVEIYNGRRRLRCDQIAIDRSQQIATLKGDVQIREPGLLLIGEQATLNNTLGTVEIDQATYVVHDNRARGKAERISLTSRGVTILKGGQYTSCEPTQNNWHLRAAKIKLNQNTGFGAATHARIYVKSLPIFYLPYMEFPIDDRRKSGLLFPVVSRTNNNGIDLALPYYLNLAPHYDMTLTPRYINAHGLLSEVEVRYKQAVADWTIGGTFLDNDKKIHNLNADLNADNENELDEKRWAVVLQEKSNFQNNWQAAINYHSISDKDYLEDLGTTGLDISRSVLLARTANVTYLDTKWNFQASLKDYQVLTDLNDNAAPYQILPRLTLNHQQSYADSGFKPLLSMQYSFFEHASNPRGQHIYTAPGISFTKRWLSGYIKPVLKLKHTQYVMNESNESADPTDFASRFQGTELQDIEISGSHSVSVPSFTLDSAIFFERAVTIGDSAYLQTLTPRFFYVGTEYQDQTNLPNFEPSEYPLSPSSLFREDRFSGKDRIGDANQLSMQISSDFFEDNSGRRTFGARIGQILYFRDRRVTSGTEENLREEIEDQEEPGDFSKIIDTLDFKKNFRSSSDITTQLQWQPTDQLQFQTDFVWDPYNDTATSNAVHVRYLSKNYNIFNFSYRFDRFSLFQCKVEEDDSSIQCRNEQANFSTVFPISKQWNFIARWHYDITDNRTIEDITGLEYNDCCWRLRMIYQRERESSRSISVVDPLLEYDYVIMLQIELKGLGGISGGVNTLLDESILGYRQREENYR